jgi:hypothetical protein
MSFRQFWSLLVLTGALLLAAAGGHHRFERR